MYRLLRRRFSITIKPFKKHHYLQCFSGTGTLLFCGGGGIRTPGALSGPLVFKTSAINHSATPPKFRRNAAGV